MKGKKDVSMFLDLPKNNENLRYWKITDFRTFANISCIYFVSLLNSYIFHPYTVMRQPLLSLLLCT